MTTAVRTPTEAETLEAADAIVRAFAETDTERYFAGFASDATFMFHPEPARLASRAEYETLWKTWLDDGWKVVDCRSSDRLVQAFPGGAVFSHTVDTTTETDGEQASYTERETIVFRVDGDGLTAIHEHLSAPTN